MLVCVIWLMTAVSVSAATKTAFFAAGGFAGPHNNESARHL